MAEQLIVVGIDPGTTTAIAALDLNTKKVLFLDSARELTVAKTISILIGIGRPVVVGTDKMNVPSFVQKVATKFGAKVVKPLLDLSAIEKKELTKNCQFRNDHEQDALACAIYAYDRTKFLLDKINKKVRSGQKEGISEKIKGMVIKKGTSFERAVEIIESKPRPKETRKPEPVKEETEYTKLLRRYNQLKKELKIKNSIIERLNLAMKNKNDHINGLKIENEKIMARKLTPERRDKLLNFKEQRIRMMQNEIYMLKGIIGSLRKEMKNQDLVDKIVADYKKSRK
ncbi:DUF460 domain-containing protein [Candidatus Woesearchaeota archaeon]|nr:DUF460 domain-containing protein [Candidatus Woesearchaeota archaeon]